MTVLVPHTASATPGFSDEQQADIRQLLDTWLQDHGLAVAITWLYTPMALPLAQATAARCMVYDCMDELAAFKGAPIQLREREAELMATAALVLTGGPSLFQAKRAMNANVHCLPSAVDAAHFARSGLVSGSEHEHEADRLQADLPHPRLGYFGVIDERLDVDLLAELADAHPDWAIVMAGPVVKIDPQSLPQRGNIHWLGMQPYERLPYLLAEWDLCLMPFALNEATRFISPTKTLEYMAGEKPVVSTPVRDVIALYGSAVEVAYGCRKAFIEACERVLSERGAARYERAREMLNAVSTYSWDRSATGVHELLLQVLAATQAATVSRNEASDATPLAIKHSQRRAPVTADELRAVVPRAAAATTTAAAATASA